MAIELTVDNRKLTGIVDIRYILPQKALPGKRLGTVTTLDEYNYRKEMYLSYWVNLQRKNNPARLEYLHLYHIPKLEQADSFCGDGYISDIGLENVKAKLKQAAYDCRKDVMNIVRPSGYIPVLTQKQKREDRARRRCERAERFQKLLYAPGSKLKAVQYKDGRF